MKEQFRDEMPTGRIKTKYWIDKKKGTFKYWYADAEALTDQITQIVEYYESIRIRLTNRQLYYQLVGKDYIPNALEIYKRICTFLTHMRYAGLVDWRSIEDKGRAISMHSEWDGIPDLIKSAISSYRLPRCSDQEYYLEMYCEKEAGINVLQPVANKYHISFGYNKGYSSAAAMYELAQRVRHAIEEDEKHVKILYFGDHDPSGLDMVRDITERITEFLLNGDTPCLPKFEVISVSLTMDQINEYNLPPNPAKITDPRAKWYIEEHGEVSWELDAIDAQDLQEIAEVAIEKWMDMDLYEAWFDKEEEGKNALVEFGKTLE